MALNIAVDDRNRMTYIGVPISARFSEFGTPGGPNEAVPRIYQWLAEHEINPIGGPLFIYRHIGDPADPVDLTVGVPIAEAVRPSAGLALGTLPPGTYLVGRHTGPPDENPAAQAEVRTWAEHNGMTISSSAESDGESWTGHAEHFLTNPADEPDKSKWVTELLYLTE